MLDRHEATIKERDECLQNDQEAMEKYRKQEQVIKSLNQQVQLDKTKKAKLRKARQDAKAEAKGKS